jgi:hypothetical protein
MPRPQFRLRSLFIVTSLVAIGCLLWRTRPEWMLTPVLLTMWVVGVLLLRLTRPPHRR